MGTKRLLFILLVSFSFFTACTGNKETVPVEDNQSLTTDTIPQAQGQYFFNGDFTYFADVATFKDCITGNLFSVAMIKDYKTLEKKYLELKKNDQEAINCNVIGYLIHKNTSEEVTEQQLVVTKIISMDKNESCNTASNITNCNYAHYTPDNKNPKTKTTLAFNKDYTFQCTTYQLSPMKLVNYYIGEWHRMDIQNIVLLVDGEVLYEGVIDFNNMSFDLQNDNEKNVIFKKE